MVLASWGVVGLIIFFLGVGFIFVRIFKVLMGFLINSWVCSWS